MVSQKMKGTSENLLYRPYGISLLFVFLLFIFSITGVTGQTYGLRFASHNVLKEKRTSLDLNHNHFFSFREDFQLSFNFLLNEHDNMYFGYIVRIIDDENKNLDMIFNYQSRSQNSFEIVYLNKLTTHPLKSDFFKLCSDWTSFQLQFNLNTNQLTFSSPDTSIIIPGIELTGKVKILFGASDYSHFKTTDVPPMSLKDIRIMTSGKLIHEWPLNEVTGETAYDQKQKLHAHVINPEWISPIFQNWVNVSNFLIEGNAEIAYNDNEEKIYIIGDKYLISYNAAENQADTLYYYNPPMVLKAGCQAFFEPDSNMLVSYNIDLKTVSTFNLETRKWNPMESEFYPLTVFWHHNKFYSVEDKVLYTFGGYGQHEYKNTINRLNLITKEWERVIPSGDNFSPRYLAALGEKNDTIYILGGYGSLSGKQILNPQNYYDLWLYSRKENRFIKNYSFYPPEEDITFANSMIIDHGENLFYALAFPIFKDESKLQLYKGSLHNPELIPVGNTIPYRFHDIISFADLYHAEKSKKLLAVTSLYNEENHTAISIYHISFPPNEIPDSYTTEIQLISRTTVWAIVILFVLLIATFPLIIRKFKKVDELPSIEPATHGIATFAYNKNSILFFGDFQFLDKTGVDLTSRFSPLLKELFMLIWFNTIKDKGISTERIIDILWFDKDGKSAKNNLAVNMAKLKQLVGEMESMSISRQTGYWTVFFDDNIVFNDYYYCLKLARSVKILSRNQISDLIAVSQKGHFLESCTFTWLDEFKAEISNVIMDILISYSQRSDIAEDPDFIMHLADAILNIDILNEEAIHLKCKALIIQGKHNLAKDTFAKFTKEYSALYNSPYKKSFIEIIK